MPMEPAFNPETSKILFEVAKDLGYEIRNGGTVVVIEGPHFSSKAESNALRLWGGDLVGMTTCPEVLYFFQISKLKYKLEVPINLEKTKCTILYLDKILN